MLKPLRRGAVRRAIVMPALVMATAGFYALAVLAALAALAAATLAGCAGVANNPTAKMAGRGGIQIAPHVHTHSVLIREGLIRSTDSTRTGKLFNIADGLGGSITLGVSERVDVRARYDHNRLDRELIRRLNVDDRGRFEHSGSLEAKFATEPGFEAVSLGYGLFPEIGIHLAKLSAFHNFYFNRSWYYCLSPSAIVLVKEGDGTEWGYYAALNQSLTYDFRSRFYVRPELGLNVMGLIAGLALFNVGVSAGVAF